MLDVTHPAASEVVALEDEIKRAIFNDRVLIIASNGVADAVVSLISNEECESDEASGHVYWVPLIVSD